MNRFYILLATFIVVFGSIDASACPICGRPGHSASAPCLVVTDEDRGVFDALIAEQRRVVLATPAPGNLAAVEFLRQLVGFKRRLEDSHAHPLSGDDLKLLDSIILARQVRLTTDAEVRLYEQLVSLQERAKHCALAAAPSTSVCTACGHDPCTCTTSTATCCGKCGTAACTCGGAAPRCCPPTTVTAFFLEDNAELRGVVDGIDVGTCHGPIHTGPISVEGIGKESSRFAAILLERARLERRRDYDGALATLERCNVPVPVVRDCYGITGRFAPRPMVMYSPSTVATGRTRSCVAWTRVRTHLPVYAEPLNGRFWCSCRVHIAEVRRLYGYDAVWELVPCLCAGRGCRECAAGGCGH